MTGQLNMIIKQLLHVHFYYIVKSNHHCFDHLTTAHNQYVI